MEDQQQQQNLAVTFPGPPPFWESFTPENLSRISELRVKEGGKGKKKYDAAKELPIKVLDLPAELRFLQPPELPTDGYYKVFGEQYDLADRLPTLEESGVQSLYTPPSTPTRQGDYHDRAFILKRIAKSLLLNFLELVGILSINPDQAEEKLEDLRVLFINFHHLLNEYRPHQARESLILMMQDQLERSRKETEDIRQMKEKVQNLLEGLGQAKLAETEEEHAVKEPVAVVQDGEVIWDELEKTFG